MCTSTLGGPARTRQASLVTTSQASYHPSLIDRRRATVHSSLRTECAMRLAVIGAGNWGTTLAVVYARLGNEVVLWDRNPERVRAMHESRENARYLPAVQLPEALRVTSDLAAAVHDRALIVLAVPAQAVRALATQLRPYLPAASRQGAEAIVVIAAKGLELGTGLRMSEVVAQSVRPRQRRHVAVLSGPNLAGEIVRGLPAAPVVAARHRPTAALAQQLLATPRLRLYVSSDVTGVELGGALKNVMALVAGVAEGLGYGDNGKASIMTRGLAEIARLGVAAGARQATFAGLSGLGDLIATCTSPLSRNHYVGYELGRGRSLAEIQAGMSSVAEGITTTRAALELARGICPARAGI